MDVDSICSTREQVSIALFAVPQFVQILFSLFFEFLFLCDIPAETDDTDHLSFFIPKRCFINLEKQKLPFDITGFLEPTGLSGFHY